MIRCLGEALVDLICERPAASLAEADSFRPHFGGALANVAVAASRAGAEAGLAGAAGDDEWGRWLRGRLEDEGVDLEFFDLAAGAQTPVAFATVDDSGEPSFLIYGEAIANALDLLGPRLEELVEESRRARLQLDHPGRGRRATRHRRRPRAGAGRRPARLLRPQRPPQPLERRLRRGGAREPRTGSRAASWSGPTATRRWRSPAPRTRAPRPRSSPRWTSSWPWSRSAPRAR